MARNYVLEKTVDLMLSDDYKDRFLAEYKQLVNRRNKLTKLVQKAHKNELDFELSCPLELLEEQLSCMNHYVDILKKRAKLEKISLK